MFSGCLKNVTKVLANTNTNAIFANASNNLTNAPKMVNLQKPTLLTPILVDNLKRLLKEADYDQFKRFILISGFKNGFSVHFEGPPISSKAENHISDNSNAEVVRKKKLQNWRKEEYQVLLINLVCSFLYISARISTKCDPNKFRLIHDLSFPKNHAGNTSIPQIYRSVTYETLDHSISQMKKMGVGALVVKEDIDNASRIIPIAPDDYHLLGFKLKMYFTRIKRNQWM